MPASTRFAVAIHAAGMLAMTRDCPVTSEAVARSVCTNPVVVRRVIGMLAKSGLLRVQKGQSGGATLARAPEEITLDEIYLAVQSGPLLRTPPVASMYQCPVARNLGPVVAHIFRDAEAALLSGLRKFTLADVLLAVRERAQSGRHEEGSRWQTKRRK